MLFLAATSREEFHSEYLAVKTSRRSLKYIFLPKNQNNLKKIQNYIKFLKYVTKLTIKLTKINITNLFSMQFAPKVLVFANKGGIKRFVFIVTCISGVVCVNECRCVRGDNWSFACPYFAAFEYDMHSFFINA